MKSSFSFLICYKNVYQNYYLICIVFLGSNACSNHLSCRTTKNKNVFFVGKLTSDLNQTYSNSKRGMVINCITMATCTTSSANQIPQFKIGWPFPWNCMEITHFQQGQHEFIRLVLLSFPGIRKTAREH